MRKMKALTVKMEKVPLIGKFRYHLIHFVYYVYVINSKIFFTRHFICGRGVVLSCIQLNMVLD